MKALNVVFYEKTKGKKENAAAYKYSRKDIIWASIEVDRAEKLITTSTSADQIDDSMTDDELASVGLRRGHWGIFTNAAIIDSTQGCESNFLRQAYSSSPA